MLGGLHSMLQSGLLLPTQLTARARTAIASRSVWRSYVASSSAGGEPDENDIRAARDWLKRFETVPENWYTVSYSRSSGPGGQNVNKLVTYVMMPTPRLNTIA